MIPQYLSLLLRSVIPAILPVFPGYNEHSLRAFRDLSVCHTLAELYAVLTRLPVRPPIAPEIAEHLIARNLQKFEVVTLMREDYQQAINRLVSLQLPGGVIYDALIAQCALKTDVEQILTLNPKHFIRLGEDVAQRVEVPS